MFTNADMTLYSCGPDGKYTRVVIERVFWQESKQRNIEKTGLTDADSIKIFIPKASAPDGLVFNLQKDMTVKGISEHLIDNTSPQTISISIKALRSAYDVHAVTVADGKLYGSQMMQHYQISCK
ncbi:MAG: hypothetical protein K0R34_2894 [Herbinix sp.]|jgi:hypothetical protein|nr:hypothetical protein [Herbinix sp.]